MYLEQLRSELGHVIFGQVKSELGHGYLEQLTI